MVILNKNLPVDLNRGFRYESNANAELAERALNDLYRDSTYHRTSEKQAHNSGQIIHDGWTVERELKYRAAQVRNLVIGANGDGIAETKDARVAVFSKKAHATLSERLLEDFTTLSNKIDPIYANEYSLNLSNKQAVKFADIATSVNGIIRGIAIDSRQDEIYIFQKEGTGAVISRHQINGVMLDKMTISGETGSPISLGLIFPNGKPTLLFNVKKSNKYYIAVNKYVADTTIASDRVAVLDILTSTDEKTAVSVDIDRNELLFIRENKATVYNLAKSLENIMVTVRSFTLEKDELGDPLKGFKYFDGYTYLISGTQSIEMTPLISIYDENGNKTYNFKVDDFKHDKRIGVESALAWAIDVYHDDYTNKMSLVFGVTYADDLLRKQQLFAVHQSGRESDHAQKILSYSQNYAMLDGAGRMFNVLSTTTSLKQLKLPGNYYIRAAYAGNIKDIPGDLNDGEHGYFVENSAYNDYGVLIQKVRVYSINSNSDVYERSYDTTNESVGQWLLTSSFGLSNPTYMTLPVNQRLASITRPGEQYIASDVVDKLLDLDDKYKGNGYLFSNSCLMASNGRVQTMTRNSTSQQFLMLKRIVNDDGVTAWKEM